VFVEFSNDNYIELNPDDLNTLLTNPANGVLECLVKESKAKDGNLENLVWVIEQLNPADLNTMLAQRINSADSNDTVLNLPVKATQAGYAEYFA
jgi:hypothetical protein